MKFDRQIVAIAKVFNVSMIYSDDADVRALATIDNIPVTSIAELPLPPAAAQTEMSLIPPDEAHPNQADDTTGIPDELEDDQT